ncbi:MAG: response regulator [Desulfosarcina sp.]|nr:response regulator [Desulfobacterales bacterium]
MMEETHTILIADRNAHVRKFLMREMMKEGYRIMLAGTGENVLRIAYSPGAIDLLILDPDLPGMEASSLLKALNERLPALPVVLHAHRKYSDDEFFMEENVALTVIEKEGDSVERIKEAVGKLLQASAPDVLDGSRA